MAVVATLVFATECQTVFDVAGDFGRVALDRAQTISSALALRDGYVDLKTQITENADTFTPEEQTALEFEAAQVEGFYEQILQLSRGGSASEIIVNADEFLTTVLIVRGSVDRAINIIQPKIGELNPDGAMAAAGFIADYNRFSFKLDELLMKNNRAEAVQMAARFLKAAAPVVVSLLQ
ncbi:hypothetical protein OAV22_02020 [Flavobacteriaceae bacterium]|nr:hypothetical protein [Flavobacteriaceae bacterium]